MSVARPDRSTRCSKAEALWNAATQVPSASVTSSSTQTNGRPADDRSPRRADAVLGEATYTRLAEVHIRPKLMRGPIQPLARRLISPEVGNPWLHISDTIYWPAGRSRAAEEFIDHAWSCTPIRRRNRATTSMMPTPSYH